VPLSNFVRGADVLVVKMSII